MIRPLKEACLRTDLTLFLKALNFSAEKHRHQRRKDTAASPYINHPIEVANILWMIGEVYDVTTIIGALLHDTLEDTDTTPEEIRLNFGNAVLALVKEVSDDKSLPKQERKQNQIIHSPHLSRGAQEIKLADKICNVRDIACAPPGHWPRERRLDYLNWARAVIDGLRGANDKLEQYFDETLERARKSIAAETGSDA
ncbi:MAG: bifunctional (p)ppGpp synthetase/guanosine-3',5'-bis(diphosphate) 3'-pyrophosphohydrolase [Deltaproteobacteria bacterium]|nr:bifunctional (p)ppGpp synthetase/guanosine-3',5'-bis(diphosphate) 3'-pyrophosphohydrolase [Deltaproteobacteria bacterium]